VRASTLLFSPCGLVFIRALPGAGLDQGSPDHWNGRREDRVIGSHAELDLIAERAVELSDDE
jgi:hypothetical protein